MGCLNMVCVSCVGLWLFCRSDTNASPRSYSISHNPTSSTLLCPPEIIYLWNKQKRTENGWQREWQSIVPLTFFCKRSTIQLYCNQISCRDREGGTKAETNFTNILTQKICSFYYETNYFIIRAAKINYRHRCFNDMNFEKMTYENILLLLFMVAVFWEHDHHCPKGRNL